MYSPQQLRKTLAPALALAALSLLAGCGGGGSSTAPLSVSARTPEGLTVALTQASATVPTAGTLQYTLTLTNATSAPVSYQVATYDDSAPPFPCYLSIYSADGQKLYPPLGDLPVPSQPHLVTVTLQPGQSSSVARPVSVTELSSSVPSGQYRAVGYFSTSATDATTPSLAVRLQ